MNRYQKNEEFQIPKICNDNAQIKIKFKKYKETIDQKIAKQDISIIHKYA